MNDLPELRSELNHLEPPTRRKPRRRWIRPLAVVALCFVLMAGFFYVKGLIFPSQKESWVDKIPLIGQVKHLVESADRKLIGEERDRVNVLLLGVGGKNHDGGQLSDTIMIASVKPSTKQVSLFSIPRDLAVPQGNMGWLKINSINAYAEQKDSGSGGTVTREAIGDLLEAPIDYYVRVDFDGFEKIIDEVGGVDVMVDNTLDDYAYPVRGREDDPNYASRFEHLHVDKGIQHMDGNLALKFARSRHGVGGEGSDFARARRQQKIIEAVRAKILSANTLLNPQKITGIISELQSNISTNLKIWEIIKLWSLVKDVDSNNIINKVLDNSQEGLLVDGKGENGAYILSPRAGNFSEIKEAFANIFGTPPTEQTSQDKPEASKPNEDIRLSILNGTWVNGLGSRVALGLERDGVDVVEIGNSSRHNFEKSVIYDLGFGAKRESLEYLKKQTGANIAPTLPDWLKADLAAASASSAKTQPDFILILGTDMDKAETASN